MEVDSSLTTYTFLVKRNNYTPNTLENYVFKSYTDGNYEQLILTYNYSIGEDGSVIFNPDYLGVEVIDDENLIVARSGQGCLPELLDTMEIEVCWSSNCNDGGHEPGDDSCKCGKTINCKPASEGCTTHTVYNTAESNCSGGTSENPNGTSNPYGTPSGGGNSNPTPNIPLIDMMFSNLIKACINDPDDSDGVTLSDAQFNTLTTLGNQTSILNSYLNENGCSVEAQEFAVLAIESGALEDNDGDGEPDGEVDFEENIIYEGSFDDYPCQKLIIQDASGSCSPLTSTLINIFESNDSMNLIFKTSPTITSNANTSVFSSYNSTTGTCNITITFSENYLETATDLAIAKTTIHESLHALFVYMYNQGLLESNDGTPLEGFEDLLKAYTDYMSGLPPNFNSPHHELMADFVQDMATSLSTYGQNNNHSQSFNFYERLTWGGLTNTDAFNTLYPQLIDPSLGPVLGNTNFDRYDINRIILAEQTNENQTLTIDGTTYSYTPQGNTPNNEEPCN